MRSRSFKRNHCRALLGVGAVALVLAAVAVSAGPSAVAAGRPSGCPPQRCGQPRTKAHPKPKPKPLACQMGCGVLGSLTFTIRGDEAGEQRKNIVFTDTARFENGSHHSITSAQGVGSWTLSEQVVCGPNSGCTGSCDLDQSSGPLKPFAEISGQGDPGEPAYLSVHIYEGGSDSLPPTPSVHDCTGDLARNPISGGEWPQPPLAAWSGIDFHLPLRTTRIHRPITKASLRNFDESFSPSTTLTGSVDLTLCPKTC